MQSLAVSLQTNERKKNKKLGEENEEKKQVVYFDFDTIGNVCYHRAMGAGTQI